MQDAIDAYLAQGRVSGWVEATVVVYARELAFMVRVLRRQGCRRVADVTPADLDAVMQAAAEVGFARRSRIHAAVTVRSFFRWLQERGRIASCPAATIPVPDAAEVELPKPPLSEAEVAALFDAMPRGSVIDLRNRCLLELLYGCGLRIAEALALNGDDIDITQRTLHVRRGKGHQQRLLPVMGAALAAVQDYQAVRRSLLRGPDTGALLLNQYGGRLTYESVRSWMWKFNAARGPEARHLHFHLFRHSIAVHLLRGGADIRYIQHFLGHADLDTTKIYLRLVPGRLKEDYEKAMPEIDVGVGS
jgi:site-specific recombinase XerD